VSKTDVADWAVVKDVPPGGGGGGGPRCKGKSDLVPVTSSGLEQLPPLLRRLGGLVVLQLLRVEGGVVVVGHLPQLHTDNWIVTSGLQHSFWHSQ